MRYKIGITEAGDAGIDLSWQNKLSKIDGAILITKNITTSFIRAVLPFYGKVIVHATITGYGGSIVEPNVPNPRNQFLGLNHLLESGFSLDHIVIRVDPIIPTTKGIDKAKWVIDTSDVAGQPLSTIPSDCKYVNVAADGTFTVSSDKTTGYTDITTLD